MFGPTESNDINLIPPRLQGIYKNPYRVFGLDENNATISMVRDSFRKLCLGMCHEFAGLGVSKTNSEQIAFAYYLIRGAIPKSINYIHDMFENNNNGYPWLDFRPQDILPVLRPMNANNICAMEYRGCRMLSLKCTSYRTELAFPRLSRTVYTMEVYYCMRKHTIEKDYEDFQILHDEVKHDMITMPKFPDYYSYNGQSLGDHLARYCIRIHSVLASKLLFSPRLFKFLGIDFERVQSEEEGAILQILDQPNLPAGTIWHIIDEEWLQKWRRFVMGRGARRYIPPGKIQNANLLAKALDPKDKNILSLKIARDYRCVNYNVWAFYIMVHGGGPVIARREEDIYSHHGISFLQGVVLVQTHIRMFLDRKKRLNLYDEKLSERQAAKSVIIKTYLEDISVRAEEIISKEQNERKRAKLLDALKFTQSMWRKKKSYIPEANLRKQKRNQEVFSRLQVVQAAGDVAPSKGVDGLIVEDIHPIVQISSSNISKFTLTETTFPFKTKRFLNTETAIIADPSKGFENIYPSGSKIISVNGVPASSMTYELLQRLIVSSQPPIVFEIEKPLQEESVPALDTLLSLEDEVLQYNGFKQLLANGVLLIKHNRSSWRSRVSSHISLIRITDKDFFYRSKTDKKQKEKDLWHQFSLFNLKFLLGGKQSETIMRAASRDKSINPNNCFEIVLEDRGIAFELATKEKLCDILDREMKKGVPLPFDKWLSFGVTIPNPQIHDEAIQEKTDRWLRQNMSKTLADYHEVKCKLFCENVRRLVLEVKGHQMFVDEQGVPVKRTTAKASFRKI